MYVHTYTYICAYSIYMYHEIYVCNNILELKYKKQSVTDTIISVFRSYTPAKAYIIETELLLELLMSYVSMCSQ